MNVKKIIAAFAAAALGASLTLTPSAIENVQANEQEIATYSRDDWYGYYDEDSWYGAGQLGEEQYATLTEEQKSDYFKVVLSPGAHASVSDMNTGKPAEIINGCYVWKAFEYMYIYVTPEVYEDNFVYVNSYLFDVKLNGDGSNYGNPMYIGDYPYQEMTVWVGLPDPIDAAGYNSFPQSKQSHYAKVTVSGAAYCAFDKVDYYFENATYYLLKNQRVYFGLSTEDYPYYDMYLNGVKLDLFLNGDSTNYIYPYWITDTDTELTVTLKRKALGDNSGSIGGDYAGNNNNIGSAPSQADPTRNNGITGFSGAPAISVPVTANSSAASAIKKIGKKNITVTADGEGITKDILSAFKSNKKAQSLTVKYSSTLKIEISKDDISGELTTLDFTKGSSFLSAKKISSFQQLKNSEKVIQLNFTNDGNFGGVDKVTVKSYVGSKLSGKTADIYEYKDGKLVRIGSSKINASGFVDFKTDHYGKFVIAIV
ncbi:MAG: hypothetical protein J1E40_07685 [Oscillospiraceae bacterium]|nr:hypothetical protein [Oscillospiraceae bacterium]